MGRPRRLVSPAHQIRVIPAAAAFLASLMLFPAPVATAAPYQDAVKNLKPTFYYQLNEATTDNGVIDSMGNATAPGTYLGDYVNGPPAVGGEGPLEVFGGLAVPGVGGSENLAHYSNNAGHIILGDGPKYGANAMTVAFFMKAGPSQGGDRLFTNNLVDPTKSFQVDCGNNGLIVAVDQNATGVNAERTLYLEDNSTHDKRLIDPNAGWFHVVASTQGATGPERAANIKVWINGVDRTANLQPDVVGWGVATEFAKIGGRGADPTAPQTHSGAQDEMSIWLDRVLTGDEVQSLWQAARRTPLLSDNFNTPDTGSLDGSDQTGRRGGLLGNAVQLRSSMIQHGITGNQLNMLVSGEARVRFHDSANLGNWWNWAAGDGAAAILSEGGMRVEFDWTPADNTSDNWISYNIGFPASGAEPGFRVNDAGTDFGILLRNNGGTQYFDNGAAQTGAVFPVETVGTRHVTLDYAFGSFNDGAPVSVTVAVDGVPVLTDFVFQWNGNSGTLAMEIGNLATGTLIDNLSVSTLGVFEPDTDVDGLPDSWEQEKAGNLTDLNGSLNGPGPGADSGNFDGDTLTDKQEYQNGLNFPALNPKLADSDGDGLEDGIEIAGSVPRPPTNPTLADTDGDGMSDSVENNSGTFVNAGNPGTSPITSDTDSDYYPDVYEIQKGSNPNQLVSLPTALPEGMALGVVTDEASTGINPTETFTHKINGGGAISINGVDLDGLTDAETPLNFNWEASGSKNIIAPINNGNWIPSGGGVTGDGNLGVFGSFTYSGSGATAGNTQTFTLSGLQVGQPNEVRLFIRKWANDTVRPAALKITNGTKTADFFILEDRPGTVLGNGNDNTAYFINYRYVPTTSDLVLQVEVPNTPAANGSFHMYALTNRVVPQPGDSDADGLADVWEQEKAGNLTDLNGRLAGPGPGAGTGNFDGDSLSDLQEYNLGQITYPNLNPKAADTDGDGLEDGAEVNPTAPRIATNPTIADGDGDGLSDSVESNSGVLVNAGNTGSNPNRADTDNDQYPDAYEVQLGSNPSDASALPTALPQGIALGIVTDEASTGISASEVFTHKINGGGFASVNGVDLDALTPDETPLNFEWDPGTGGKNVVINNNGTWNPTAGNVTGDGNLSLFGNFTYSGGGPTPGSSQRFVLSGLNAGQSYEMRVFIRKWDNGTVRPSALKMTNGTAVTDYLILEDRPGTVTGNGNDDTAYYISYSYVAQGPDLIMDATVPAVSSANGSFHLYGLTNRQAAPSVPAPVMQNIVRANNGASVTLTIATQPGRTYAVDYSTTLTAAGQPGGWVQINGAVASQGTQTTYIDTQFSTLPGAFYRVRDITK